MPEFDSVGTISFFRERHRVESVTTAAVLHAMPEELLAHSPHPASSTVGMIAWTIIRCLRLCNQLAQSVTAEISHEAHPSLNELFVAFEMQAGLLTNSLLEMDQHDWCAERWVTSGGHLLLRQPLGQIFWLFHVDAIHHRGQISTYLRGFGAKVPSIYGPSGDSPP
jgi:uncharacterized damage-inducible protein DinB